ncbi:ComF family protein [Inhella gelatinilytica]|uniref:ComF family protein n=1 Tax=Inhella gelatinilytica TaxID=2795030 RepID=A0A931NB44_9BURK|nr:ComF family protein [Inhella gelatinilytica]MBH9553173.1 ComF family protein [Inhella gelatinilytica]
MRLLSRLHPRNWPLAGGCWVCLAWGSDRVCTDCRALFLPQRLRCSGCALPLPAPPPGDGLSLCGACLREPLGLDHCHAAVDYQEPWADLLKHMKFRGHLVVAEVLVPLWPLGVPPDVLLPVPQHPDRLVERGFNPPEVLAQALARRTGWAVQTGWLLRPVPTPPQTRLTRAERHDNLRGAFALSPRAQPRGLHIALVDDVLTTGATLSALAQLLRRQGAAQVSAYVAARTPDPTH